MISLRYEISDSLKLSELEPFQGSLKKRTPKDLKDLSDSLKAEGLIMPFVVWNNNGKKSLIDGHGRLEALKALSKDDPDIENQSFPVVYLDAQTEEEARKLLLQVISSYGKVTRKGAIEFCKSIPEYHAPSIDKFVHKPITRRKLETPKLSEIIRIEVPVEKAVEVRKLLSTVTFIKVM